MHVGVDQHRHHGLAGEVHASGARRHAHVGGAAGRDDARAVDDQHRVLDRGAAVAHDEARAFERGDAGLRAGGESEGGKETKSNGCGKSDDVHPAHRSLHREKRTNRTLALLDEKKEGETR